VVIQEVIIPPPPPPPPPKKIEPMKEMPKLDAPPPPFVPPPDVAPQVTSTAPAIQSTQVAPTAPAVIAPPPPPSVETGPKRTSIGLACPKQVQPEMPVRATRDGIEGEVKAQIHIKNGAIVDVTILSGNRVFHAAVKAAMMQYKCVTDGGDVLATQDFSFKLE
jgi:protein TonB